MTTPLILAQAAPDAGGATGFFVSIFPLVLIFAIFYFLLIRPQARRARELRTMVENVKRGDQVVTAGGLIGKVTRVEDEQLEVEVAQGTRVRVVRSTIANVAAAGAPRPAND